MTKRKQFFCWFNVSAAVACALGALCVAFRFFHLDRAMSYDELYTLASSDPTLTTKFIFSHILVRDINAPLYNLLIHFWALPFGAVNEWILRAPSVLASLAALAYAWWKWPRFLGNWERLSFVTLLACSHNALFYAQDARVYSFLMLASVYLTFQAVSAAYGLINGANWPLKKLFAFSFVGLISCYLHYFGAALFFSYLFILFCCALYNRRRAAPLFWNGLGVFALFSPWLLYILSANPDVGSHWWARMSTIEAAEQIIQMLAGNLKAAGAIFIICLLGTASAVKTKGWAFFKNPALVLPFFASLMIVLFVLAAKNMVNLMVDRYFLVLLPPLILLVSLMLGELARRHAPLSLALPALLFVSLWPTSIDYALSGEKFLAGTKDATRVITQDLRPKRFLVFLEGVPYPPYTVQRMFSYYVTQNGSDIPQTRLSRLSLERAFLETKHPVVLMPVCSKLGILNLTILFDVFPARVTSFNSDSCLVEVSRLEDMPHAS